MVNSWQEMNNNPLLISGILLQTNSSIMKSIETNIEIKASKSEVWKALTNLKEYKNWNPFIVSSDGKAILGEQLINTMNNGEKSMTFKPRVTDLQPEKRFEWLGHLFIPGLFDGRHYFELEEIDPQHTRLVQGEYFSGILSGVILRSIEASTVAGFEAMNEALKRIVEQDD